MGICCSKEKYLDIDKNFSIIIKTNIYNGYLNTDLKYIVNYVKNVLENEGSTFRDSISHYVYINRIYLITGRFLGFHINLRIDKKGKHRDRPENYCVGKILKLDEIKRLFSLSEIKSQVYWSLGTASNCGDPLLLHDEHPFNIKKENITFIEVF